MPTSTITNIRSVLDPVGTAHKKVSQQPLSTAKKTVMQAFPERLQLISFAAPNSNINNAQNVKDMIDSLNDFAQNVRHDIRFSVDLEQDKVIIKVIDSETKELIRTIPPEEIVNLVDVFAKHTGILPKASI